MEWIKVTPDTMPPDEASVIATVEKNGKRRVFPEVRFNEHYNVWQYPAEACMDYWEDVDGVVTHWAHYPEPAEDQEEFMNIDLECQKDEIKRIADESGFKKVHMVGMYKVIKDLKDYIEKHYTDISYMTYDIGYHGWLGEEAENMKKIDKAINDKIIELYAICIAALGEV